MSSLIEYATQSLTENLTQLGDGSNHLLIK